MATAFHCTSGKLSVPDGNAGAWFASEKREEEAAQNGSAELRIATNRAIFKWGFKHGITSDQARVLLMDWRMP